MRWCAKVSLKTEFQQMGYAMVIWPVSHLRIASRASALRLAEAAEGRAAGQWHQVEFHQVPRGQGGLRERNRPRQSGAVNAPGEQASANRDSFPLNARAVRMVEGV
jgi:hypothetical protein